MAVTTRLPAPASGGVPVFGHALQMRSRPREFLLSLQPGPAVAMIRLARETAYVINDPELIRQVVRHPDVFSKGGPITERFRLMFGNGLGISAGEFHERQRALLQPAFHHVRIMRHAAIMTETAAARAASWHDGQRLAVDKEMADLALANVTRTMFSADTTVDREQFMAATTALLNGLFRRVADPIGLLAKLPTQGNRRYQQATDYLRRTINNVISGYRASGVDHGDLLS